MFVRREEIASWHARLHFGVGRMLVALGAPGLAARAFRDAVHAAPRLAPAHFALGDALGRRGRWAQAAAAYGDAARLRRDPEYQGNLVHALGRAFLWRDALAACDSFGAILAEDGEAFLLRGLILRRLGRPNEAILAFRRAAQLPAAPAGRRFYLGEALFGVEAWQRAQAALSQARGIGPRSALGSRLNAAPPRRQLAGLRRRVASGRRRRALRLAQAVRRATCALVRGSRAWWQACGRGCRIVGLRLARALLRQPHHALRAAHGLEGAGCLSRPQRLVRT
ncbi:MAG TPA: hypothetical protein VFM88_22120 [Vicinamibacteria bacterium]|nr:hypothetical protein [Vicinamibacteria bacterium]